MNINRLFPKESGGESQRHMHVFASELPDTLDKLTPFCTAMADQLVTACNANGQPAAPIVYAFVSEDGFMPPMCEVIAKKIGKDPSRMSLAFLSAFGAKVFEAELRGMKTKAEEQGEPFPPSYAWLKNNVSRHTFAWACWRMEKLTCDCPACIVFWAGKQCMLDEVVTDYVDQIAAIIKAHPERGNEGCIKHLLGTTPKGIWLSRDDEKEE